MPCDFFRVGVRAGDTQKGPEAFEERDRLLLGARGGEAEACPKGTSESGPFRSTASLVSLSKPSREIVEAD
jgi:hypothetical protein